MPLVVKSLYRSKVFPSSHSIFRLLNGIIRKTIDISEVLMKERSHSFSNFTYACNAAVKRQLRRVGIFWRLNLSFLLLLLVSSLFLTFFSFYWYSKEINLNLDRYTSLLTQNVELKITDTMNLYEDLALSFYDDASVLSAISENTKMLEGSAAYDTARLSENSYLIQNRLYAMSRNKKYIENIEFVSPTVQYRMVEENGFSRGGVIRDLESFYASEFYLLPQEQNGYPIWMDDRSQTHLFFPNEQAVYGFGNIITLGIAVYEPSSRDFLGVLLLNIDLNAFSGTIEGYNAYEGGNTFLVGESGVLTWFHPSLSAPPFPNDPDILSDMKASDSGITRTRIDGRNLLLSYEKVPGSQMFAAYVADLDMLLSNAYRIRNLCFFVFLCVVIASFVISYYVTRSISDPIRQLIGVMDKTADGSWSVRYENAGNDEITILGDQFNKMAEKTDRLIDQVYVSEIHRQRALLSWKNAQLDAMLMQINPHFLYNTLDIIRWEAMYEANGESKVTQMIEAFSRLCRMGIKTGSNTVRLSDGIAHAATYLEVINFRHSEKIELCLDTQVDTDACYVPQFMLQPLMENAVTHAFGDASSGFCITLRSRREADTLLITVADNGRGMTAEELDALLASLDSSEATEKGIGLRNVHQRIRLFYGDAYGISVTSTPNCGTQINITLPIRTASENMTNDTGGNTAHELSGFNRG